MFLFIAGVQPRTIRLDERARVCPRCGHSGLSLERTDHYFSLFFIPLFRVKKGVPLVWCDQCHSAFDRRGMPLALKVEERVMFNRAARKCPDCGRPLGEDFDFCPRCGNKVSRL